MKTFRGDSDYKGTFERAATCLIDAKIEDRDERMTAVQALIDEYITQIGEKPDGTILEQLTDYILREELTDDNPHKVTHNEYPFLSRMQLERRQFGQRGSQDSNIGGESSLDSFHTYDADGRNHRYPARRKLTEHEQLFVDQYTKIRNKARAEQYKLDTSPGAVLAYNLYDTGGELTQEFVACWKASEVLSWV
ncbi:hypothetical protein MH117_09775 [Paenibacillus sp. ACRRX]|uniref:hypothetical protein n=1 Tax=Paenibacillus sp. ACRRX TaxID=2918206 RepID=UPI001EF4E734|nr:hypothetical protein [Paenibacillus sp. ACRRX]MCG7407712.1 hypothetical protein [Paenibacillus sp. ACRRX]